jgi:hypothetical protein
LRLAARHIRRIFQTAGFFMDGADQAWTTSITCLVVCDDPLRILFTEREGGLVLPRLEFAARDIDHHLVVGHFRQQHGRDVRTLRRLHESQNDAERRTDILLYLDDLGPLTPQRASRWVAAAELPDHFGVPPTLAKLVRTALAEAESGIVPPSRRPWECPGWHIRAEEWMRATAAAQGYTAAGPIEDIRTWSISRVLRLPTDRGCLYFKASGGSRLFCQEALVTDMLARRFPAHVPSPIAIKPESGWMLTPDFGGPIGNHSSTAHHAEALRQFAKLQVEASASVGDLLDLGCTDRRLPVLAGQIRQLLPAITTSTGLTETEITRLKSSIAPLAALCARLATYRVPPTLTHGDLHMNNIAMRKASASPTFLFFDWTDACISHPFLDLIAITASLDGAERAAITAAYLEPWTTFEPMPRLWDMVALALPLIAMHQAISYQAIDEGSDSPIINGDEAAIAVWLRRALNALPVACQVAGLVHC